MSILIKGLTAKELLDVFEWARTGANNCMIGHGVVATELPDHGDLVDRDEFIGRQQSWALLIAMGHGDDDEWVKCIGEVCDHLYDAPVVIPADRSESDER